MSLISSSRRMMQWSVGLVVLSLLVVLTAGADYKERKWTSASGSFSISATLVELKDGKVVLKKNDGKTVTVPLDKLSSADRVYVQEQTSSSSEEEGAKSDPVTTAAGVEAEAERMPTAKQALLIYQFHLSSDALVGSERRAAEKRRDHWKDLAEKDYQRLGKIWMTTEEADAQREKAQDKIKYGYEMLRLGNGELSEKALREASKLDPDNVQAEFLMGLVYAAIVDDDKKAIRHFQECLERDPTNVGALNNMAICHFNSRNYNGAVAAWLKAVEISPETPALGQNVGSLISIASRSKRVRIPKRRMALLSDAYEALISKHGQQRPAKIGFVYLPPTGLRTDDEGNSTGGKQLVVVGSGSGFVIAPNIIATNHHVIEGAEQLMVLDPKDTSKHLAATLIAADEEIDVALIKCPKLDAPPLVMCKKLPPRGSDIMVLGYPLGPSFGANLKSTRGSMVAMPDAANDHLCLYDALTNPGNSGGPCVDSEGRVVAVVRAITGNIGGTYGAAIPMERAMTFFKKHLPDLEPVSTAPKKLEWTEVDATAAPSTVLILQKQSTQSGFGG